MNKITLDIVLHGINTLHIVIKVNNNTRCSDGRKVCRNLWISVC